MRGLILSIVMLVVDAGLVSAQMDRADANTIYNVSYVEIKPSARDSVIAALKQYRDASRKEEGYLRTESFEEIGRPGHLTFVEVWRDQKALDSHEMSASTKRFRDTLETVRISDYDERPYTALTIQPASNVMDAQATYVITHVDTLNPTSGQELLERLATASRKESGCLRFDVLQHASRKNHFTVIEAWKTRKALDDHVQTVHAREYRDGLHAISGGPLDERLYKLLP